MSHFDWCLFALAFLFLVLVLRRIDQRLLRMEESTTLDPLTGFRSGRQIDADLLTVGRSNDALAVVMIDLDDFRRFNEYGYREGGDQALRTAAACLQKCLQRELDLTRCYRMHTAGDEFLIVLAPCEAFPAARLAAGFRQELEANGTPASIGVVLRAPRQRFSPAGMLRQVEAQKTAAKKAGKNQVCIAPLVDEAKPSQATPAPSGDANVPLPILESEPTRAYSGSVERELRTAAAAGGDA